jgi:hypothetical protein
MEQRIEGHRNQRIDKRNVTSAKAASQPDLVGRICSDSSAQPQSGDEFLFTADAQKSAGVNLISGYGEQREARHPIS